MSPSKPGGGATKVRHWIPKLIVADVPAEAAAEMESVPEPLPGLTPPTTTVAVAGPEPEILQPLPIVHEPDPILIDQARAEGYALGVADGRRQSEQRALQEAQDLRRLFESIGRLRADLESALPEEVLSLAVTMARQVVREAFLLRPEAIVPVLRDALQVLPALNQQTVLHLHPQDAALVKPLLDQDPVLAQTTWRVIEDTRMERGGCRLETPESEVDATLPARWSRVLAALGREDIWQTDKVGP